MNCPPSLAVLPFVLLAVSIDGPDSRVPLWPSWLSNPGDEDAAASDRELLQHQILELLHTARDRDFGWQALDAGCPEEAHNAGCVVEYVTHVGRL